MKKLFKPAVLAIALSTLMFTACESTDALADTLMDISAIAAASGDTKMAKYMEAGAKATKAMEDITPEQEYYIGRAVAATVLTNYEVYENKKVEVYANKICRTITINSEDPNCYNCYHVKLLDSNEINAFATSSGIIFITKGLYETVESEDQLASVIAHEVGHILLKHSTSTIKSSRWADASASTASAVLVSMADNDEQLKLSTAMGDMVEDVTTSMITNGYSKTQEYDADLKALELLATAGYNPNALIEMLTNLNNYTGKFTTGMFHTHPSPKSRIKNIKTEIDEYEELEDTSKYRVARFNS